MVEEMNSFCLWKQVIQPVIQLLGGAVIAICAEPVRQILFKPNIELSFDNTNDFVSLTPERGYLENKTIEIKAYYIKIKVINTKNIAAKDCKAYLVNIEKLDANGKFKPTIYCDSIPLAWSCQNIGEQYNGININKGVNQFADVIVTRHPVSPAEIMYPDMQSQSAGSDILYPQIKLTPFRYEVIFKERGTFRFTVQVTSSNADPKTIKLILNWTGIWDKFSTQKG